MNKRIMTHMRIHASLYFYLLILQCMLVNVFTVEYITRNYANMQQNTGTDVNVKTAFKLSNAQYMDVDKYGNVYYTDTYKLYKMEPHMDPNDATVVLNYLTFLFAGGNLNKTEDGIGTYAYFLEIDNVRVDNHGNLHVADKCALRYVYTDNAEVVTIAGSTGM